MASCATLFVPVTSASNETRYSSELFDFISTTSVLEINKVCKDMLKQRGPYTNFDKRPFVVSRDQTKGYLVFVVERRVENKLILSMEVTTKRFERIVNGQVVTYVLFGLLAKLWAREVEGTFEITKEVAFRKWGDGALPEWKEVEKARIEMLGDLANGRMKFKRSCDSKTEQSKQPGMKSLKRSDEVSSAGCSSD
jgi:hypothetical protein